MSELTTYSVYAYEDDDYGWITAHEQNPDGLWVFASSAQEAIATLETQNTQLNHELKTLDELQRQFCLLVDVMLDETATEEQMHKALFDSVKAIEQQSGMTINEALLVAKAKGAP